MQQCNMISVTTFISFIHTYDKSMKARPKSHHISHKLQKKKVGHWKQEWFQDKTRHILSCNIVYNFLARSQPKTLVVPHQINILLQNILPDNK